MQFNPEASFEDAGFSSTCHGPQDYQSLLMHRAAVGLLQENPALQSRLLSTLGRWDAMHDPWSQSLRDEWLSIITERNWSRALEVSERGNQLRQASPLSTLLSNQTRYDIIRHVRLLKEHNSCNYAQS
jgi:hypothetical protein